MKKLILTIMVLYSAISVNISCSIQQSYYKPEEIADFSYKFTGIMGAGMMGDLYEKKLSNWPNLKVLNLSHNEIEHDSSSTLASFLKDKNVLPQLEILDLSYNNLKEEDILEFTDLLMRPNFKFLAIQGGGNASSHAIIFIEEEIKERLLDKAISNYITLSSLSSVVEEEKKIIENKLIWSLTYEEVLNRLHRKGLMPSQQRQAHLNYMNIIKMKKNKYRFFR